MSLKNEMITSLENLKNLFGDRTITGPEIITKIASQSESERFKLILQVTNLRDYTAEPNRVPHETNYPTFYYNFSNPHATLQKILSPPDVGLFIGQYERRNVNGRVSVPSKIKRILDLEPILIPNKIIFDEKVEYLVVFPDEVWKKYKIMGYLTSKNVGKLFVEICLNTYRPISGKRGYMDLPENQAESVGIRRNDYVTWAGVGYEVELWRTDLWKAELERAQNLAIELYS